MQTRRVSVYSHTSTATTRNNGTVNTPLNPLFPTARIRSYGRRPRLASERLFTRESRVEPPPSLPRHDWTSTMYLVARAKREPGTIKYVRGDVPSRTNRVPLTSLYMQALGVFSNEHTTDYYQTQNKIPACAISRTGVTSTAA